MKKLVTILILLVYFTVSSGFVVSFHYCMNKLASTGIGISAEDACDACGMEKGNNHCCWDDVKVVKLQVDHFASQFKTQLLIPALLQQAAPQFIATPFFNFLPYGTAQKDTGPPLSDQDVFLRNRVFRI